MSGIVNESADARSKTIGQNFRCRAWVRVLANGNVDGSANVSTVGKSNGVYTVNFLHEMPNTTYSAIASMYPDQTGHYQIFVSSVGKDSVVLKTTYDAANLATYDRGFCLAIFY